MADSEGCEDLPLFNFLPCFTQMIPKRNLVKWRQADRKGRKAGEEESKVRDLVEEEALLASQRLLSFVFCIK